MRRRGVKRKALRGARGDGMRCGGRKPCGLLKAAVSRLTSAVNQGDVQLVHEILEWTRATAMGEGCARLVDWEAWGSVLPVVPLPEGWVLEEDGLHVEGTVVGLMLGRCWEHRQWGIWRESDGQPVLPASEAGSGQNVH